LTFIAEEQFAKVDAQYSGAEDAQRLRFGTVEDRMLSFQRQLEERSRAELNANVCVYQPYLYLLLAYIKCIFDHLRGLATLPTR